MTHWVGYVNDAYFKGTEDFYYDKNYNKVDSTKKPNRVNSDFVNYINNEVTNTDRITVGNAEEAKRLFSERFPGRTIVNCFIPKTIHEAGDIYYEEPSSKFVQSVVGTATWLIDKPYDILITFKPSNSKEQKPRKFIKKANAHNIIIANLTDEDFWQWLETPLPFYQKIKHQLPNNIWQEQRQLQPQQQQQNFRYGGKKQKLTHIKRTYRKKVSKKRKTSRRH